MRITRSIGPAARIPARSRRDRGFVVQEPQAEGRASHSPPLPPTSMEALVALATAEPAPQGPSGPLAQAETGLALLDALDRDLSDGLGGEERLRELADWSQSPGQSDDPELSGLIDAIRLRALVEIAKAERDRSRGARGA